MPTSVSTSMVMRRGSRDGKPITYGWFSVRSPTIQGALHGLPDAPVIDYGLGAQSRWTMRAMRDPLVCLEAGSADRLRGVSYLHLGFANVRTPSFFSLRRGGPLSHGGEPPGGWRSAD